MSVTTVASVFVTIATVALIAAVTRWVLQIWIPVLAIAVSLANAISAVAVT